jgi:hypothetical protein
VSCSEEGRPHRRSNASPTVRACSLGARTIVGVFRLTSRRSPVARIGLGDMVTMSGNWLENGNGIGDRHVVNTLVEVGTALAPTSAARAAMHAKRV